MAVEHLDTPEVEPSEADLLRHLVVMVTKELHLKDVAQFQVDLE